MAKQGHRTGLPTQPAALDLLVIAGTAICLLFWIFTPADRLTGIVLILAAALQLLRLMRWAGWRTTSDPLVLILHIGYLWIPAGLLLLGLSILSPSIPRSAAVHALTAGAMKTMIFAVMTRATLGHTGRDLHANPPTVALYGCVTAGALLRVAASLGIGPYSPMLDVSAILWAAGLVLFLTVYGPMLWRPRQGQPA